VIAVAALIILAPLILATAALVRVTLGSPVLFRQIRPGKHGVPFAIVKFRTMRTGYFGEDDASRLTWVGRLLRSSSVDELPELFNVVAGNMSLVGPRPLLMQYLDRYTPEQMRRHEVRPGITGLAQVNGRNSLEWESKFELDVQYVNCCSFRLDAEIVWKTISAVMQRKGISHDGHATAPEFVGGKVK